MYGNDSASKHTVTPRIIIHGGAGNINRDNLPPDAYNTYRSALLSILRESCGRLSQPGATALDTAAHAVTLLENNALFNSGHGAVFTRDETHELEASIMVSRGYQKRGVGVMKVRKAKNPILLAKEMLLRGEEENGGGAQSHVQLEGETCDKLAVSWGLKTVPPGYFWTKRRWDEHRKALGKSTDRETYEKHRGLLKCLDCTPSTPREACQQENVASQLHTSDDPSWSGRDYLPQGTVGCVVLDSCGTLCVATSTGGITNKLPGRIGDTPTLGAGFWAEEWHAPSTPISLTPFFSMPPVVKSLVNACMPFFSNYTPLIQDGQHDPPYGSRSLRAVAVGGTGNGDSFLRLSAARTAAAMARFSPGPEAQVGLAPLQAAVTAVVGPHGMLQQSAEDRWHKTGEGEGGMIGIDFSNGAGKVVADFNCGGLFRVWIDDSGRERMMVFREEY